MLIALVGGWLCPHLLGPQKHIEKQKKKFFWMFIMNKKTHMIYDLQTPFIKEKKLSEKNVGTITPPPPFELNSTFLHPTLVF